ncbi:MAG: toxin-antitoxin system HicB family antitoxin [Spirochaetes bacterium]|nr:toxin-antitoxin system HicB family antitoxin [Spirochaetota bacterium]
MKDDDRCRIAVSLAGHVSSFIGPAVFYFGRLVMRYIAVRVPDNIHKAVKIKAAREGVSIQLFIIRLLEIIIANSVEDKEMRV